MEVVSLIALVGMVTGLVVVVISTQKKAKRRVDEEFEDEL